MKNYSNNNSDGNEKIKQHQSNMNQNNSNHDTNKQSNGIVNWAVELVNKYGKTYEIALWILTVVGILWIPLLAFIMIFFAYAYSKVNPSRGKLIMAIAAIGGIIAFIYNMSQGQSETTWYYFWY